MRGLQLFVRVRFPDRRRLLLVVLDLSSAIAVRTVVTVTDPAAAIATGANLHRQRLSCFGSTGCPGRCHSTITTLIALPLASSNPGGGRIDSGSEITFHPARFQAFARAAGT